MKYHRKQILFNWYIKLISAFTHADWRRFHELLFDQVVEGWYFTVVGGDFSDLVLSNFPGKFLWFKSCNFSKTVFQGGVFFPTTFENCDLKNADFRFTSGYVDFINCDLRGVQFNETTKIYGLKDSTSTSTITDCLIDDEFKAHLRKRGVTFKTT